MPLCRAEGYTGSARHLRRPVALAKASHRRERRTYRPWVLVGPAGPGKGHTPAAVGRAAVEASLRVRYLAAVALVETLYRGLADNSVGRLIEGLLRPDS